MRTKKYVILGIVQVIEGNGTAVVKRGKMDGESGERKRSEQGRKGKDC